MTAFRFGTLALSALGCLLPATSAQAAQQGELRLKPETPWVVDGTADRCQMARKFVDGHEPVLLAMRAYAPGYDFEITLAAKQLLFLQKSRTATIAYGTQQPLTITGHMRGTNRDYGPATIFGQNLLGADPAVPVRILSDPAFEAQLDHITLADPSRRVVFETGPMAKAFQALRACTDGLVRSWGLDPQIQRGLTRRAMPIDLEWARQVQTAYPFKLAAMGRQARVHLRLLVAPEGTPTRCDTAQAFANTEFAVKACDIVMKGARFHPALDSAGKPVMSYYATTITYLR